MAKRGDFTATGAFYWDDALSLAAYAGTDVGSTPYSILLTDAAGKTARGFIGAVGAGGAGPLGESLDTELVTNGDNEAARMTIPLVVRGTCGQSNEQARGGTYSAKYVSDGTNNTHYIRHYVAPYNFKLYRHSISSYLPSGQPATSLAMGRNMQPEGIVVGQVSSAVNSWVDFNDYANACGSTTSALVFGVFSVVPGAFYWYMDNCSVKNVLDPPSTGVHIVSAYGGGTRAWTSIDSGFDPNTITTAVTEAYARNWRRPRYTTFGGSFVIHKSTAWSDFQYSSILLENGFDMLLENGSDILLEQED